MSESKTAPMMDCESVVRGLWDFIDAELDAESVAKMKEHLEACGHCRSHADFEQRLVDELAGLRRECVDPAALRVRIEEALKRAKQED